MEIYRVGGAVRDKLLGLPVKEQDWVVVGATPEEMLGKGFKKVGKDFPVFLHPHTQEEYALARTERKSGKGYYGFTIYASPEVTLEEDLSRRDITINAIAESKSGEIIDPCQGQRDLKNKILRHITLDFREDPVRILRVARFASRLAPLGFKVAPETLELMRSMVVAGEVDALVAERVWREMDGALGENDPTQFFLVLRESNALSRLWPSLDKLWGVPQPEQHHPEVDTGVHTLMALKIAVELTQERRGLSIATEKQEISESKEDQKMEVTRRMQSSITRFAVLCHDLGKGETPMEEWPSHRGHEERGVPLIEAFCDRYRVPHEYRELAVLVSRYHLHCHRAFELKSSTLLNTLERLDAFRRPERFFQFLLACEADARGRKGLENQEYPQAKRMYQAYLAAKAVEVKALVEAGFSGQALSERLHQKRVEAIEKI